MMAGTMPVLIAISMAMLLRGRDMDNGAFDGLPRYQPGAEHVLHNGHYASLRPDGATDPRLPFLPVTIIREDTLRLFMPYQPTRHTPLMRQHCPQALAIEAALRGDGLDCLAKLHPLQIDGEPVTAAFFGGSDPVSGQRGAWAMISLLDVANGQHELLVQRPPRLSDDGKPGETLPPWRIPFWKQRSGD